MHHAAKQSGMTTIGWLIVLLLVAFFALAVVRLAPGYMEYFSVASTLDGIKGDPANGGKPVEEIRTLISRRFDMNDVKTIKAANVKIVSNGGKVVITADYEVREPLIANVDVVSHFHKQVEMPAR